jgi:uncharacterized membrane protein YdbT with pleckstrin-like domain
MSATAAPPTPGPFDIEEQRARIQRALAETEKLLEESLKLRTEGVKLGQEARALDAQEDVHRAGARKLDREYRLANVAQVVTAISAAGVFCTGLVALLRYLGAV